MLQFLSNDEETTRVFGHQQGELAPLYFTYLSCILLVGTKLQWSRSNAIYLPRLCLCPPFYRPFTSNAATFIFHHFYTAQHLINTWRKVSTWRPDGAFAPVFLLVCAVGQLLGRNIPIIPRSGWMMSIAIKYSPPVFPTHGCPPDGCAYHLVRTQNVDSFHKRNENRVQSFLLRDHVSSEVIIILTIILTIVWFTNKPKLLVLFHGILVYTRSSWHIYTSNSRGSICNIIDLFSDGKASAKRPRW